MGGESSNLLGSLFFLVNALLGGDEIIGLAKGDRALMIISLLNGHQHISSSTREASKMSRPPVHTIRMGMIKACIWKQQTKFGNRYHTTVCRIFKNGDLWQESTRFSREDIPLVVRVMDLSLDWIYFQSDKSTAEEE